ncbi:importin-alpha export receptor [Microbotryomycetes sp. JL201]|nr:importin-alpha export receptor [Microbotryomycetes sp. JL201]
MDSQLTAVLGATLSPDATTRRQAERELLQAQAHPSFGPSVLQLAQNAQADKAVRQSAALSFKNWIKANWALEEAPTPLTTGTAQQLKDSVVAVMISLAAEPALQVQIGEAIAIMAHADFPDQWQNLIDQTDTLFSAADITPQQHAVLQKTVLLLLQLYHDLNAQDLPEFFEDRLAQFMNLLLKYLDYAPPAHIQPATADDDDEEEETDLEKIKAEVCEIAELYSLRYLDAFGEGGFLGPFVERTWGLLTKLGSGVKYDSLVSKATGFLGAVVKMPSQRALFESPQTLEAFSEKIVLPNMTLRAFEEELFEDDPPEYVRRDLDSASSETRRQAASDFTKALMEQFESQITAIITRYVGAYLQQYAANPTANWKSKDTAIFLLTSIASRGSTAQQGVTSTNALVDVVQFFSEHILPDLQAAPNSVHPIIQADAIKFLYTFRNQLTKEQLLSVLPLLNPHLANPHFVIHTYAAITIERMLFIKQQNNFLFTQADIGPHAQGILDALFKIIESGQTPQQIAANDILMKSVMRVIITARQSLTAISQTVLQRLTRILGEISKNPSNPKFNHFIFESISALIRFITAGNPAALADFETSLFPPFQAILQQDVSEFTPFVFQILSQLLELHGQSDFPDAYKALLPPLLTPTLWEARGNVPALVRLLRAFLSKGAQSIVASNQLPPMLGIFQHLVASKGTDQFGFELLEAIYEFVPFESIRQYMSNPVFVLLLTRLQGSKTDKFSQGLLKLICLLAAINKPGVDTDGVIAMVDGVQPGLFGQVLPVLLPEALKAPLKDRKVIAVGLSNLLTQSNTMFTAPTSNAWTPTMTALLKLFALPLPLSATGEDEVVDVTELEETGYQASYSRLGASEKVKADPVAHITDPKMYLAQGLSQASQARPGQVLPMIEACGAELAGPFLTYMSQSGLTLA